MNAQTRSTGWPTVALLVAGLATSFAAIAGVYTVQESTTNTDYAGFQLSTVVVDVRAGDPAASIAFGQRAVKEFKKRGVTRVLTTRPVSRIARLGELPGKACIRGIGH